MLSVAVLSLWPVVAAQPAPAEAVGARTSSVSDEPRLAFDLRAALEELPEHAALVVLVPDPAHAAERLTAASRGLEDVFPEWSAERVLARLRAATLLDAAVGIDPRGPLTIVFGLGGGPDVVRLSLADRGRFEAWARERGAERAVAAWGGDPVFALQLPGYPGIACVPRGTSAWCQLGVATGTDPLAALRRLVDAPTRRLGQLPAMLAVADRLPDDADVYTFARPDRLGEPIAQVLIDRAHRAHPYAGAAERRAIEAQARRGTRRIAEAATLVRAAGASLSLRDHRVAARLELELSDRGALIARSLLKELDASDPIVRWAETPSLGRVVARVDPEFAAELLALARIRLPPQRLSGTLAFILLGIDTQCPSAKATGSREAAAWPFVFPLAGAIGLAGDEPIDRALLVAGIDVPADPRAAPAQEDVFFRGRLYDSPVEARLAPGTILVGTGHGAASAAARRWEAPPRPVLVAERRFIDARLGLASLGAALTAGAYDGETRPELRQLERVLRALQPMTMRFPSARLTSYVGDSGRWITVQVHVGQ